MPSLSEQRWLCLVKPLFPARNVNSIGAYTVENNGRNPFFLPRKGHDFSARRYVRTFHQVMTFPAGNTLVDPAVDTERCISAAIPGLAPDSFVESELGHIYTFPQDHVRVFLIEEGLDPTSSAFWGWKLYWILCQGRPPCRTMLKIQRQYVFTWMAGREIGGGRKAGWA